MGNSLQDLFATIVASADCAYHYFGACTQAQTSEFQCDLQCDQLYRPYLQICMAA